MGKEYKLNKTFEYKGHKYIVIKCDDCISCDFFRNRLCNPWIDCDIQSGLDFKCFAILREDKTNVIFKKV